MHKNYVPLFNEEIDKKDLLVLNPLVLSFVGDSVQTLYVRTKLGLNYLRRTGALHILTCKEINAVSQSVAMKKIMDKLTDEESAVFRRGRNAKTPNIAKHASPIDYHIASGFEAVIGYLYLLRQSDRIEELIEMAYGEQHPENHTTDTQTEHNTENDI
ncbi:MAG: ribonuclease III domain-containing protein [Clostridia bacterium]|nr:ribonuclease III domain-containing protein [Clostridia bacterium]